jgi:outer membrane receptor for ferrienterochelin and colicins
MNRWNQTYAHFPNTVSWHLSLTVPRRQPFVVVLASLLCASTVLQPLHARESGQPVSPTNVNNVMDLSLDQLLDVNVDKVYGASKYEQKVSQAPSSVSLVMRDEIQKQGYRTLADVLRGVNGVYVSDDRNYSYIGMRGFNRPGDYNSRVLMVVDGHRINDNVYGQALVGTEAFLDVNTIERVEVVRGPSSSIYGNNAFFGVVNVITRRGRDLNGAEISGEVGGHESFKGSLAYGKLFDNGVEVMLSGSAYSSQGERSIYFPEFDSPAENNGVAWKSDEDSAYNVFGSVNYSEFTLSGGWSWRDKTIPTASFETEFNDGGEKTMDSRSYLDLKYDHEVTDTVRFVGRVAYDYSWYEGDYPYGVGLGRVLNKDKSLGEWASADWQVNWRLADRHTLIVGGDYRENLTTRQENFDAAPFAEYLNDDRSGREMGLFAQAELSLMTNLVLNVGGRYDHYSTFGDTVNPRVGLIFTPFAATAIKALYGSAYRAPNAYELYYSYPAQSKANPNLKPEEIKTYELVWEQGLPANLRFSVAGYFYEIENLTSQNVDPGDGLLVFENSEKVNARGVELSLEGRYESGLVARLSCAFQRTEDELTQTELSNSPRQMAKLNVIAPLVADKLFAGIDLQYYSAVDTVSLTRSDDIFNVNATLTSRPIGKNLEISASVHNLFDSTDGFSASSEHVNSIGSQLDTLPRQGRTFILKLTYRF